jgi:hypothetical protein
MVVHEITRELVTITEDSYAIQHGAFRIKANAENTRKKLEKITGKKIDIVVEDGFYKVRIPDIKTRAEVDSDLDVLRASGVTEVWVLSLKAKKQLVILREREDTLRQIDETIVNNPEVIGSEGITVQLGAFRDKSNAIELMKQLKARYGDRLRIVFEEGFYKLRLSGMSPIKRDVLDELNKQGPNLPKLKFKDIWMAPPVATEEEEPVVPERSVIRLERAEKVFEIPEFYQPDTLTKINLIPNTLIRPESIPALTISIQVGVFERRSDARKAQRKIISKLKLKVEIVEQWDRYFVLIRGFHTREETYKYYPELAGLGYPGVSLIEE